MTILGRLAQWLATARSPFAASNPLPRATTAVTHNTAPKEVTLRRVTSGPFKGRVYVVNGDGSTGRRVTQNLDGTWRYFSR